uniref:Uncharacterized protein n=1 Tax=Macrostomum lignano TaxID=282301 RepID=A0A1I8JFS0_9PLAT
MHNWEMPFEAPRISQNSEIDFHYTQSACIGQRISQFITEHCNCTSAFHLSDRKMDKAVPFCSRLPEGDSVASAEQMLARIACARNISLEKVYSEPGDHTACRRRCVRWRYSVEQSNSDWRPLGSQLRWMKPVTEILSKANGIAIATEDARLLEDFFADGADGNWTDARSASDEGMAMVT